MEPWLGESRVVAGVVWESGENTWTQLRREDAPPSVSIQQCWCSLRQHRCPDEANMDSASGSW